MNALVKPLPRGVHICPWVGEHGGMVLAAIDGDGTRVGEAEVTPANYQRECDKLWAALDACDPPAPDGRTERPALRLVPGGAS